MDTSMQLLTARNARLASAVALGSFVGFLVTPSPGRTAVLTLMDVACVAVVVCTVGWLRRTAGARVVGGVAVASALGLVGSVVYLNSIADEPAAIPLGGMFVLLLSLVGLGVSCGTLRER